MLHSSQKSALALFVLVCLLLGAAGGGAAQEPALPQYRNKMVHSFKGGNPAMPVLQALAGKLRPDWQLFGSDALKCVKFDNDGLRITIPASLQGNMKGGAFAGLSIGMVVKGDFEITTDYEFLEDPGPLHIGKMPQGFVFTADLEGELPYITKWATLSRLSGDHFAVKRRAAKDENFPEISFPAMAKNGRLRMVRTGAELSYLVSEGDDAKFNVLQTVPFAADNLTDVRVVGYQGNEKAPIDLRITELTVLAESIEKKAPRAGGFVEESQAKKDGKAKPKNPPKAKLAPPAKDYAQEYHLPFIANPVKAPGWHYEGPAADECFKWHATGLLINLPTGYNGERPSTGIRSGFGVKGDFELTFNYEMLKESFSQDANAYPTRLSLEIFKDVPETTIATASRSMGKGGPIFVSWARIRDKNPSDTIGFDAKKGRLRLVRSGPDLYFGVSREFDGPFQYISKSNFGTEDLRDVRITASTGGADALLEARVTDLRIRADSIPNAAPPPVASAPGNDQPTQPQAAADFDWLRWAGGGFAALLVIVGAVMLLSGRKRPRKVEIVKAPAKPVAATPKPVAAAPKPAAATPKPATAAAPPGVIAVACSCGKSLKAKVALAGKRVKCPECGAPVLIPK
jgi:hypothetical protein